jgi:hypothetical protein
LWRFAGAFPESKPLKASPKIIFRLSGLTKYRTNLTCVYLFSQLASQNYLQTKMTCKSHAGQYKVQSMQEFRIKKEMQREFI